MAGDRTAALGLGFTGDSTMNANLSKIDGAVAALQASAGGGGGGGGAPIGGAVQRTVGPLAASVNADTGYIVIDAAPGEVDVTWPSAAANAGRVIYLTAITNGTIMLNCTGSDGFGGLPGGGSTPSYQVPMPSPISEVWISDGVSMWFLVSEKM